VGARSTGLKEIAADCEFARDHAIEEVKKVVGRGSLNVKKAAQATIRAASHRGYLPHYPRSITYDVTARGASVIGEIGPDPARLQGGLGRLLEYGSRNNAPIPHLGPAVDAEEPVLAQYLEELGVKLMEGHGGPPGPVQDPE
jgi:hypothetical protein